MADSRQITDLPITIYSDAMPQAGIPDAGVTAVMGGLSRTCQGFNLFFKKELTDRALIKQFWQAVIDDRRKTIFKLSFKRPDLLFQLLVQKVPNSYIIESKKTFEKLDLQGETILSAAVKRKQLNVIEVLLYCYQQLKPTLREHRAIQASLQLEQAIRDALSLWKHHDFIINADGNDEIIIPNEYLERAQSLIHVFKIETFPNGDPFINLSGNVLLSEEAESALTGLLNILAPNTAVRLDDHIDAELFLLAIAKIFTENLRDFNGDYDKMDSLLVRLIGLVQSGQIPETQVNMCQGLFNFDNAIESGNEKEVNAKASSYVTKDNKLFHRESRDSRCGLGFEFFIDLDGSSAINSPTFLLYAGYALMLYVLQRQNRFNTLRSAYCNSETISQEMRNRQAR